MYVHTYVCVYAFLFVCMHVWMYIHPALSSYVTGKKKLFELNEDATAEAEDTPLFIDSTASTVTRE
jgi:hypothetical protein